MSDEDGARGSTCPSCQATKEQLVFVGGTLRMRNKDDRERFIEQVTPEFGVFVSERVGDLHLFNPEESNLDAVDSPRVHL